MLVGGLKVTLIFLFFLWSLAGSSVEPLEREQCSSIKCIGEIGEESVAILAQVLAERHYIDGPKDPLQNYKGECEEVQPLRWSCFVKQLPVEGELLPPGAYWRVIIDFSTASFEINSGF